MQNAWIILAVVLVAGVVAFEEQDASEDFQNDLKLEGKVRNRRWLFQHECKVHSDCYGGSNGCCDLSWFGNSCFRKRGLFRSCSRNPKCGCFCGCRDGLVCKQFYSWPMYFNMCVLKPTAPPPTAPPPTQEPGSGDFE